MRGCFSLSSPSCRVFPFSCGYTSTCTSSTTALQAKKITASHCKKVQQIRCFLETKLLRDGGGKLNINKPWSNKAAVAIQIATLLVAVEQPALAVTGVNHEEDLIWVIVQSAIVAFGYFLVMPPIIMNWLRLRWYKRKFFEMYLQFMCVFLFFPGLLLWAPFINFRPMPRDPTMKYPWSKPTIKDSSSNST